LHYYDAGMDAVEFVVLEFAEPSPAREVVTRLRGLAVDRNFEIMDALVVAKTVTGEVEVLEESGGSLIRDADVDDVVAELSPGTSAALLLLAHSWQGGTRAALRDVGGRVVLAERLPASAANLLTGA
jgi:uncharacterized membrane protein